MAAILSQPQCVNRYHTKFVQNIKIYLRSLPFLSSKKVQVCKILPDGQQGSVCTTQSIPELLMAWQCKETWHQQ